MGVYKLREAREVLLRFIGTIDAIAPAPRAGPNGLVRLFGCCTSDDAGVWLKALPAQIAFNLGYYSVPALAALGGDGVASGSVANLLAAVGPKVRSLVADCEAARLLLKQGIAQEYRRMRGGNSTLRPLAVRAVQIVQAGLALDPPVSARSCLGPAVSIGQRANHPTPV